MLDGLVVVMVIPTRARQDVAAWVWCGGAGTEFVEMVGCRVV